MVKSRVAFIIPALNEEETIGRVVRGLLPYGTPVVVDDASSDQTGDIARKAGALVVRRDSNGGYDRALNSGFAFASSLGFSFVITMDGDGQHLMELVSTFIDELNQRADVVIGIRPAAARVMERVFSIFARIVYGIHDPLCGMKGYRMSLYRSVGCFDSYGSVGTELILFAAKNRKRIIQVRIPITERSGPSRFGQTLKANWMLFKAFVGGVIRVLFGFGLKGKTV